MRIMTILGTRPEIIRLSRIIPKLDQLAEHVLVHTGQNYDPNLSDLFFSQLELRQPDHHMGIQAASFGEQLAAIIRASEDVFHTFKPDRLLLLGDTNSALSAIVAQRMGIPVYHMEAGNRSFDSRVPEEVNRRIIDHSSDVLMPYTEQSRANLLREGIASNRVYVTGNPIYEILQHYSPQIASANVLETLGIEAGQYFLVTLHRAENVDIEARLRSFMTSLAQLQETYQYPVVISTHPRTKALMEKFDLHTDNEHVRFLPPFGLFDFVKLEQNAFCVLTDSGTVQEECCIFNVPTVTIRDVTERPETLEAGSNILSGADPDSIALSVRVVVNGGKNWQPPDEYLVEDVSTTVTKIVLGYDHWHTALRKP